MPRPANTDLDNQIEAITRDFTTRLGALASKPALRSGLLRAALTDLVWAIYHEMPDLRYDLAEELDGFPELIKEHIKEDAERARSA